MTKLKLGPIADDKPVKVTVELPASLHRDLAAYADSRQGGRACARRSRPLDRAHAGTVHCDRPRFCEGQAPTFVCLEILDFDRCLAKLNNLRKAGLSFRGDHTAQNGRRSPSIGR